MTRSEFMKIAMSSIDETLDYLRRDDRVNKDNPILVWSYCEGAIDCAIRRKIGEELKASGRKPYTGEVEKHD